MNQDLCIKKKITDKILYIKELKEMIVVFNYNISKLYEFKVLPLVLFLSHQKNYSHKVPNEFVEQMRYTTI